MSEQENNISLNKSTSQLPIYERPGRLDPDRHIPMVRPSRVDVNIHYSDEQQGYFKDSNVPEFTDESANAMDPFDFRDYITVQDELNEDVYRNLCKNNIEIPFNKLDVYIKPNEEDSQ